MESLFLRVTPQVLLLSYITKLLINGANIADAVIIAFISALCAVNQHLQDSKFKKELQAKLESLEKKDEELKQIIIAQNAAIGDLKNYVTSAKIGAQLRVK